MYQKLGSTCVRIRGIKPATIERLLGLEYLGPNRKLSKSDPGIWLLQFTDERQQEQTRPVGKDEHGGSTMRGGAARAQVMRR
jgi:hypothetical protein